MLSVADLRYAIADLVFAIETVDGSSLGACFFWPSIWRKVGPVTSYVPSGMIL
jgi:hypothetical protein